MTLETSPHGYTVRTSRGSQHWLDLSGSIPLAIAEREASGDVIAERARVTAANGKRQIRVLWPMYAIFDAGAVGCWWFATDRSGGMAGLVGFLILGSALGALGSIAWSKVGLPPRMEAVPGPVTVSTRGLLIPDVIWENAPANADKERIVAWVRALENERGAALTLGTAYDCVYDRPGDYFPPPENPDPHHDSPWFTAAEVPAVELAYRLAYAEYVDVARELHFEPHDAAPIRDRSGA